MYTDIYNLYLSIHQALFQIIDSSGLCEIGAWLASLKSVGQVSRLEIQAGVNAKILKQNLFSFRKLQHLLIRHSID